MRRNGTVCEASSTVEVKPVLEGVLDHLRESPKVRSEMRDAPHIGALISDGNNAR